MLKLAAALAGGQRRHRGPEIEVHARPPQRTAKASLVKAVIKYRLI